MHIRNRFTLISSLIFGIIFTLAAVFIYWMFRQNAQRQLYKDLQKTCLISGIYYLEKDELTLNEHKQIKVQFEHLIQESMVAVIDMEDRIRYGSLVDEDNITQELLEEIRQRKQLSFHSEDFFYYGMFYHDNQGDFVVIVKESGQQFFNLMWQLAIVLLSVLGIGLMSIILLSIALSKIAYRPIRKVIEEVNTQNHENLTGSIPYSNTNDEIQELIESYNKLLSRVDNVFSAQKNFINYVSHEFKTPLTASAVGLEVFLQKERTNLEYQSMAQQTLENIYQLEGILTNLKLLAGVQSSPEARKTIRIDEILWAVIDQSTERYNVPVRVDMQVDDYQLLEVNGAETQLHIAFTNLIENAIKYSEEKPIDILFSEENNHLKVLVIDYGKGILKEDLPFIKNAFYRGKNSRHIPGSGIGLSLTDLIFKHHNITLDIIPSSKGTKVTLTFPNKL